MSLTTTGAGPAAGGGTPGFRLAIVTVGDQPGELNGDAVAITWTDNTDYINSGLTIKKNGVDWATDNDATGVLNDGTKTLTFVWDYVPFLTFPPFVKGDVVTLSYLSNTFEQSGIADWPPVTNAHVRNNLTSGFVSASIDATGLVLTLTWDANATLDDGNGFIITKNGVQWADINDVSGSAGDGTTQAVLTFDNSLTPLAAGDVITVSFYTSAWHYSPSNNPLYGIYQAAVTNNALPVAPVFTGNCVTTDGSTYSLFWTYGTPASGATPVFYIEAYYSSAWHAIANTTNHNISAAIGGLYPIRIRMYDSVLNLYSLYTTIPGTAYPNAAAASSTSITFAPAGAIPEPGGATIASYTTQKSLDGQNIWSTVTSPATGLTPATSYDIRSKATSSSGAVSAWYEQDGITTDSHTPTAYVTNQAGSWANSAIWTPTGVPTSTDTVTINHAVTVSANTTIGISPPSAGERYADTTSTGGGSSGGLLPAGTYSVAWSYVDSNGIEGIPSCYNTVSVASGNIPRITFPSALPVWAASRNLYLSDTDVIGKTGPFKRYKTGITAISADCASNLWENGTVVYASAPDPQPAAVVLTANLTVQSGATLTIQGDTRIGSCTLEVAAGSSLVVSTANAATPASTTYYLFGNLANGNSTVFKCSGSSGSHTTVSVAGGGVCLYRMGPAPGSDPFTFNGTFQFDCTYADFASFGSAGVNMIDSVDIYSFGFSQKFHNCTFNACSPIRLLAIGATGGWDIADSVWTNSLATSGVSGIWLAGGGGTTSTTRAVSRCVFDAQPQLIGNATTYTDNFFASCFSLASSTSHWNGFTGFIKLDSIFETATSNGDMSDVYIVADQTSGNPHFIVATPDATYDGIIFDYPHPAALDGGDGLLASTGAGSMLVKNSITLPSYSDGISAGDLVNCGGTASVRLHNNTACGNLSPVLIKDYAASGEVYSEYWSNISWATTPGDASHCFDVYRATDPSADILDPNGTKTNYIWNPGSYLDPGTGHTYVGYIAHFTSDPGATDLTPDTGGTGPDFVDSSRCLATWAVYKGAASSGDTLRQKLDAAYGLLKADPALINSDLIPWVRGGFAPQNTALQGTGWDGGDIGAVPVV